MVAEPTISDTLEARPEKPLHWAAVLGMAVVVCATAGFLGFFAGGLLHYGLMTRLVGPEAALDLPYSIDELPAEVQPLATPDGLFLCVFLFMAPLGMLLLRFALPHRFAPAREYLGLKWPGFREGMRWGLLLLAVHFGYRFLIVHGLPMFLGSGSDDDGWAKIARVPRFFPLVFVTAAILLPIFAELIARGYILEGLRRSLGEVGAVLITAALWAAPLREVSLPAAGLYINGIFLALARLRTGSIYPGLLAQVVINAVVVLSWANG